MTTNSLLKVAIFGAPSNNRNMGCLALTYSLLTLLEEVSKQLNVSFEYNIFEVDNNSSTALLLAKKTGISEKRIFSYGIGYFQDFLRFVKHIRQNLSFLRRIIGCNFAIDMTEGDSFSDIYGLQRFKLYTNLKRVVEILNIPLILGPQTYGPYISESSRKLARKVFDSAYTIIARDDESAKRVFEITGKSVHSVCDLAFRLPCDKRKWISSNKIRIGINISGLLVKNRTEMMETNYTLNSDYDELIRQLLAFLSANEDNEIHLISHVVEDFIVAQLVSKHFPKAILVKMFNDPIEAKTYISNMDVFVGSRMHATIAALSTGVPTIPIAYSPKFERLFSSIGYNHIVDLQKQSTSEAFNRTIDYIQKKERLRLDVCNSIKKVEQSMNQVEKVLVDSLQGLF